MSLSEAKRQCEEEARVVVRAHVATLCEEVRWRPGHRDAGMLFCEVRVDATPSQAWEMNRSLAERILDAGVDRAEADRLCIAFIGTAGEAGCTVPSG